MMRKLLLAGAALLQFAVIAPAVAAPCTMQTLASYILLGATGCTVDGVDFGDFSEVMLLSGATQIDSTAVTLTPLSDATGTGFSISSAAPIVAGAGELFELYFGFNATSAPGRAFTSNTITLDASAIATGDGAITIVEDKCLNGMFTSPSSGCSPPTSAVTQIVFAIDIDRDLTETAMFAPANFFDVFIDLVVDGGPSPGAGRATLGPTLGQFRLTQVGSAVPEPISVILLLVAFLALCATRQLPRQSTRVSAVTSQ